MPIQPTYPGVYVEPIIQPQPPLEGVATSITAFLGRAPMGPVNTPQSVLNLGQYQRFFGGLDLQSTISYMVTDFFNNGGDQGLIVRLYEPYFATQSDQTKIRQDVAVPVAAAGAEASSVNDIVSAMQAKIQALDLSGVGLAVANREILEFSQWLAAQTKLNGKPPTKSQAQAFLNNDLPDMVTPQGFADIDVNIVTPARDAAVAVSTAALNAATASSSDASAVQLAAQRAANRFTQEPMKTAAKAVQKAAVPPTDPTPKIPAGEAAAGAAAFAVPDSVAGAVKLSTIAPDADSALKSDLTKYATPAQTSAYAGDDGSAIYNALKKAGAPPYMLLPAAQVAAEGRSGVEVAAAATIGTLTPVIPAIPPDQVLKLQSANPGGWGNNLTVTTDTKGITPAIAASMGVPLDTIFNLTASYFSLSTAQTTTESFLNVTVSEKGGSQRIDRVLQQQSNLIQVPQGSPLPPKAPPNGATGEGTGGTDSWPLSTSTYLGNENAKTGIYALNKAHSFNILSIPPDLRTPGQPAFQDTDPSVYMAAAEYCDAHYAMLIIDPPNQWYDDYLQGELESISLNNLGSFSAPAARSAAVYFPRIVAEDPNLDNHSVVFPASGAIAGIWSATDASQGVWKSPAGLDAAFNGIQRLQANLTDAENGILNPEGINCLRTFLVGGSVVWGARTLRGADQLGDEYKYISVRRTLLYIEDSLLQNTQWAVFQPNDETLWSELRKQIGAFLGNMFRQGAFPGPTAADSYFVKCDASTNPPNLVEQGIVTAQVGFAPLYPAEFVVITIQQILNSPS